MTKGASTTIGLALLSMACSGARPEGLDTSKMPPDVRSDYDVFAQRCSKCHALSRPLSAGIDDDAYWELYVTRMRRQSGSGITPEDANVILRFLHYYSLERKREKSGAPDAGSAP